MCETYVLSFLFPEPEKMWRMGLYIVSSGEGHGGGNVDWHSVKP